MSISICVAAALPAAAAPAAGQTAKPPSPVDAEFDITLEELAGQRHDNHPLSLPEKRLPLRIIVDRPSIDVAVRVKPFTGTPVRFVEEGGRLRIVSLQANRLESIWRDRQ